MNSLSTQHTQNNGGLRSSTSPSRINLLRVREVAGLRLTEATYPAGLRLPPHAHERARFCLLLQGQYEEVCGKHSLVCKAGGLAFMAGGEMHANRIDQTGMRFFSIEMSGIWLARTNGLELLRGPIQFGNGWLPWLAMRLYREFRSKDEMSSLMIEGLALEMLASAARQPSHPSHQATGWLEKARNLIGERFQSSLTVGEVAELVQVHPVSLARAFRRTYHCTVGEYVRKLRIEFACQKLASSEEPLVEIALSAGFSEQSHFCRIFKRFTGLTPSQYRNNCHQVNCSQRASFVQDESEASR